MCAVVLDSFILESVTWYPKPRNRRFETLPSPSFLTTGTRGPDRVKSMDDHFNQYAALRGGPYKSPTKRPIYLGSLPDSAMKFMHHGTTQALRAIENQE